MWTSAGHGVGPELCAPAIKDFEEIFITPVKADIRAPVWLYSDLDSRLARLGRLTLGNDTITY